MGPAQQSGATRRDAVTARAGALDAALRRGGTMLDPDARTRAAEVLERTGARLHLGAGHTVVALVGATGSGKSSLFNALAGMEIAEVDARRPTTSLPTACVWGDADATELLDWLDIAPERRVRRESVLDADRQASLHGLVLLDLPDHDSTVVAHRLEVDRLVDLVDLLVWVVDPQKYADEALHSGYLQRLVGHDGVMVVVLNQVDRLDAAEADTCRADLRRLLDGDGLAAVRVLAVSAVRGDGVDDLRDLLAGAVADNSPVLERATADLVAAADGLGRGVAAGEPGTGTPLGDQELVDALAEAIGVQSVLTTASAEYARRGRRHTGWALQRWLGRLHPGSPARFGGDVAEQDLRTISTSVMPAAAPAQRPQVELAIETFTGGIAGALPRPWGEAVRSAVRPEGDDLVTALDNAVDQVDLGLRPPSWWTVARLGQYLLALSALAGAGWLFLVGFAQLLGRPMRETPAVLGLPLPVLLFVVGVVGGALLGLLSSWLVGRAAETWRESASARLRGAVHGIVDTRVAAPVRVVLDRHRATREALAAVADPSVVLTPTGQVPVAAAAPAALPAPAERPALPAAATGSVPVTPATSLRAVGPAHAAPAVAPDGLDTAHSGQPVGPTVTPAPRPAEPNGGAVRSVR